MERPVDYARMSYEWRQHHARFSLRDHFAGQALIGLITAVAAEGGQWNERDAARFAYAFADAMLAAREQT